MLQFTSELRKYAPVHSKRAYRFKRQVRGHINLRYTGSPNTLRLWTSPQTFSRKFFFQKKLAKFSSPAQLFGKNLLRLWTSPFCLSAPSFVCLRNEPPTRKACASYHQRSDYNTYGPGNRRRHSRTLIMFCFYFGPHWHRGHSRTFLD
jgi:hypothetical protein